MGREERRGKSGRVETAGHGDGFCCTLTVITVAVDRFENLLMFVEIAPCLRAWPSQNMYRFLRRADNRAHLSLSCRSAFSFLRSPSHRVDLP